MRLTPSTSNADRGLRKILLNSKGEIDDEILARIIYEDARSGLSRLDTFKGLHGLYGHPSSFYREHYFSNRQNIDGTVKLLSMSPLPVNSNVLKDSHGVARPRTGNYSLNATGVTQKTRISSRSEPDQSRATNVTQAAISRRSIHQGNTASDTIYVQHGAFRDTSRDVQRKTANPSTTGKLGSGLSGRPNVTRPHRKNTQGSAYVHTHQSKRMREREASAATLLSFHSSEGSVENEPVPPTKVEPMKGGRGNKYTDDDREYFEEYLRWYLRSHPGVSLKGSRSVIVKVLAEKLRSHPSNVPSHTILSWTSFWRDNERVVNEIDGDDGGATDHSVDTESDTPLSHNTNDVLSTAHAYGLRGRKVANHSVSEWVSSASDDSLSDEDSIAALPSPSCSPTPPTEVVRSQGGGNLYTDDEKVYFVQFLKWWLMKYPDVDIHSDKRQFLDALHDNVPSHSIKSWGNHWRSNKKIVAQIIAKAKTKSLTNFRDKDRAVSSSLSSCVYESGAVEVGEGSLAYFDRAFNRDERHALAKRIASEGSFLAWFGLPEEQRWQNIYTTVNPRQPNYWPTMFQLADQATLTEIEQLVKKYLTKKFRELGVHAAEESLGHYNVPSLKHSNGEAVASPNATGRRPGISGKRGSPHSGPSHSQSVKKTRV